MFQEKEINKMATTLKGIRIDNETIKAIIRQAKKEDRTFSYIVNRMLKVQVSKIKDLSQE